MSSVAPSLPKPPDFRPRGDGRKSVFYREFKANCGKLDLAILTVIKARVLLNGGFDPTLRSKGVKFYINFEKQVILAVVILLLS